MNAEQLKNSILQRAIEGKLVEQREEEGTAADLLREIKAEKARRLTTATIRNRLRVYICHFYDTMRYTGGDIIWHLQASMYA